MLSYAGAAESLYYTWSKEFLEAGKRRLAGKPAGPHRLSGDRAEGRRRSRSGGSILMKAAVANFQRPALRASGHTVRCRSTGKVMSAISLELNPQENFWQLALPPKALPYRVFKVSKYILDHCCYTSNGLTNSLGALALAGCAVERESVERGRRRDGRWPDTPATACHSRNKPTNRSKVYSIGLARQARHPYFQA